MLLRIETSGVQDRRAQCEPGVSSSVTAPVPQGFTAESAARSLAERTISVSECVAKLRTDLKTTLLGHGRLPGATHERHRHGWTNV